MNDGIERADDADADDVMSARVYVAVIVGAVVFMILLWLLTARFNLPEAGA